MQPSFKWTVEGKKGRDWVEPSLQKNGRVSACYKLKKSFSYLIFLVLVIY